MYIDQCMFEILFKLFDVNHLLFSRKFGITHIVTNQTLHFYRYTYSYRYYITANKTSCCCYLSYKNHFYSCKAVRMRPFQKLCVTYCLYSSHTSWLLFKTQYLKMFLLPLRTFPDILFVSNVIY